MISEFALFVFTTLGGLGAGMYAASAVFPVKGKRLNVLVPLIALVCLGIGGVALLLHLGHPERMFNAFANPGSGITQEAIISMVFGVIVVIDLALAYFKGEVPRALRIVGAVAAIVLCCIMGMAYYSYDSVAAWHAVPTILLFLCGDLAAGFLLLSALDVDSIQNRNFTMTNMVLAIIAVLVFAWEAVHFAGLGMNVIPFVAAAVLGIGTAALEFKAQKAQETNATLCWAAFALMFVAVVIARYAFYAVI